MKLKPKKQKKTTEFTLKVSLDELSALRVGLYTLYSENIHSTDGTFYQKLWESLSEQEKGINGKLHYRDDS